MALLTRAENRNRYGSKLEAGIILSLSAVDVAPLARNPSQGLGLLADGTEELMSEKTCKDCAVDSIMGV